MQVRSGRTCHTEHDCSVRKPSASAHKLGANNTLARKVVQNFKADGQVISQIEKVLLDRQVRYNIPYKKLRVEAIILFGGMNKNYIG